MGNGLTAIIVIVVILAAFTFFREGSAGFDADNLAESTLDSGKQAFNTGKNVVNWGVEKFDDDAQETATGKKLIEIGQIPCANNDDCNEFLPLCEDACLCQDLICYKEE